MSINWGQLVGALQQQVGQPEQSSSLFPTGAWGNLGSLIRAVGVGMGVPKAQAQSNMTEMLNTAKAFGLPGIRQLYADPKFQALARTAGATLPALPPLTPAELVAQRQQDYLNEAQQKADAEAQAESTHTTWATPPSGGAFGQAPNLPTMPTQQPGTTAGPGQQAPSDIYNPTVTADQLPSGSWRKIYTDLAQKYPDAAASLGIVTPIAPGVMSTLIKSMTAWNTDPLAAMRSIDLAFTASGYDINNLPPEILAEGQAQMSQQAQLYFDNMRAQMIQRINAAGLSQANAQDKINSFDTRMKYYQARTDAAISDGNLRDAQTEVQRANAEFQPQLDQATVDLRNAQAGLDVARTDVTQTEADANIAYRMSLAGYYNAKAQMQGTIGTGSSLGAVRARTAALGTLIRSTTSLLNQTENSITMSPQDKRDEENRLRGELKTYTDQLNNLQTGIGGTGQTDPSLNPYNELNPQFKKAFASLARANSEWVGDNKTVATKISRDFQQMKQGKGAPNDPAQWDAFWRALMFFAQEQGITLPDTPLSPGG